MKNKKSLVLLDVLVLLAIAVFVIVVVYFLIGHLLGRENEEVSDSLTGTGDYDGDGIVNSFDMCKCDPGEEKNDGCPLTVTPDQKYQNDCDKCLDPAIRPKRCPALT